VGTAYLWDESGREEVEAIDDQKPTAARSGHAMEPIQDPGPYNALLRARRTSFVYPWRALAPGPRDGSVFCPLLVVSVRKEHTAFCTSNGRFLSSLQSHLSVCSAPQACLFASLSLLCFHHVQRLLPDGTQCTYANSAMCWSPVLFHPPLQPQDRSSGRTGNPCLFPAPQHFLSRNAFCITMQFSSRKSIEWSDGNFIMSRILPERAQPSPSTKIEEAQLKVAKRFDMPVNACRPHDQSA
jgi:hypothetical protein